MILFLTKDYSLLAIYILSTLCWDLLHTLRRHRQGPFVEQTDFTPHDKPIRRNVSRLVNFKEKS
jgi:hypothetical protein